MSPRELYRGFCISFRLFIFCSLKYPSADFLEEICIRRVAAIISLARVLNHREGSVYIVIHGRTVSLYNNFSVWLHTLDASSWDRNLPNFTLDLVSYSSYKWEVQSNT